jgi:phage head maturation protease
LQETPIGLSFRAALPNTTDANNVLELARKGELEMSFGFRCLKDDWEDEDVEDNYGIDRSNRGRTKRVPVRTVRAAHLIEISSVAIPAYANGATSIAPEMVAAAAAGSRSLFPSGAIPLEIRQRFPSLLVIDQETEEQNARARQFLTRLARLS